MITPFIQLFDKDRANILLDFAYSPPQGYTDIVKRVVEAINPEREYGLPDPKSIHKIDTGDYQGTLLFVIAAKGYQPDKFWAVKVSYGSCSHCDTFEAIDQGGEGRFVQAEAYFTLALHILQALKEL